MVTNTKGLDSIVWMLIPNLDLDDTQYREWIDKSLIPNWLRFEGNPATKQEYGRH